MDTMKTALFIAESGGDCQGTGKESLSWKERCICSRFIMMSYEPSLFFKNKEKQQ